MDHGSIYGIPTVHVVDFHGELVDEYTGSHGSYGKVSRVLKIPGCRASIPQYLWSKFGPTCRSRNRLMDFTRGGIWLILGICLPIFWPISGSTDALYIGQSSTFFEALHGGFCWVSSDSKICFNLSPVWRSLVLSAVVVLSQTCKLSTIYFCVNNLPKSIQILCP